MRVLFVLGKYYPYASANGVCVSSIQKALLNKGIESDVVVEGKDYSESISPYGYGKIYHAKLETYLDYSRLKRYLSVFRYPLFYPNNISNFQSAIDHALSENSYDAIIAVLKPLDGAVAASKYSNMLLYELDSITNNDDNQRGIRRLLRFRAEKYELKLYENANAIFHMMSHRAFYEKDKYRSFVKKTIFLDIPQLCNENIPDHTEDGENVTIMYSGILNRKMRSPEYAISLINSYVTLFGENIELNFFSRGNCEEILEIAQNESNGVIRRHGYVSLEELNKEVSATDFLLSIGNNLTGQVTSLPSKVISYMAYGKPIIHIDAGKNDIAKEYLSKYPLAIIIDPHSDLGDNAKKINAFIHECKGKRVPFEHVESIFTMNTPAFTANCIEQSISRYCSGTVRKARIH